MTFMKITVEESRQQAEQARRDAAEWARDDTADPGRARQKKRWNERIAKAWTFIKAVSGPTARDDTFEARLGQCKNCRSMREEAGKLYCGACGCGKWRLAELHTKLRFSNLECPEGLWGKEV